MCIRDRGGPLDVGHQVLTLVVGLGLHVEELGDRDRVGDQTAVLVDQRHDVGDGADPGEQAQQRDLVELVAAVGLGVGDEDLVCLLYTSRCV